MGKHVLINSRTATSWFFAVHKTLTRARMRVSPGTSWRTQGQGQEVAGGFR
jgi:uncharacterized protein YndB with AHSA1/START domain